VGWTKFKDSYPKFYAYSLNKETTLSQVGRWNGNIWEWRRIRFGWKED